MSVYPCTMRDGTVVRDEEHMEQLLEAAGDRAQAKANARWEKLTEAERAAERREIGRVHRPIAGLGRP